jgi:hypothetical protein
MQLPQERGLLDGMTGYSETGLWGVKIMSFRPRCAERQRFGYSLVKSEPKTASRGDSPFEVSTLLGCFARGDAKGLRGLYVE